MGLLGTDGGDIGGEGWEREEFEGNCRVLLCSEEEGREKCGEVFYLGI